MDRRVKERLIGASILVALVVLVVPELLSGPKPTTAPAPTLPAAAPDPIRNVTVDLTTSKAPANAEAEPAAPQASATSDPASAASTAASSAANTPAAQSADVPSSAPSGAAGASSAMPRPAAAKPQPRAVARSASVESAVPSPTSSGRGWSVQLGSFASRTNADNLTRQVKGQGFSVFVLPGGAGTSVRYRVRVGPLADRGSAERTAAKLKSLGHIGSLVAPAA
ncbi:MAG TPA: SPOR domain-containing protein [Steroidobacteraceae bacterium]|jgi:DedD protein